MAEIPLFTGQGQMFTPRVQLWLSNSEDEGFGHGRIELFRLIDSMGSLSKAARKLGMSYRAAWGKIKAMEQATGVKLVCSLGAKRDGYTLTPEAVALIKAFDSWLTDVQAYATSRAANYFPAPIPVDFLPADILPDTVHLVSAPENPPSPQKETDA